MTATDFCDDRLHDRSVDKIATTGPRLFAEEEHATRALGFAFHHTPEFTLSWFQTIGLEADAIRNVGVERSHAFPDTDGA